jgi:hypothetical protein
LGGHHLATNIKIELLWISHPTEHKFNIFAQKLFGVIVETAGLRREASGSWLLPLKILVHPRK